MGSAKKSAKKSVKQAKKAPAKKTPAKKPVAKKKPAKPSAAAKSGKKKPAKPAAKPAKKPAKPAKSAKKPEPPVKYHTSPKAHTPKPKVQLHLTKPKSAASLVAQPLLPEELFENTEKDFVFAFAESMKNAHLEADSERTAAATAAIPKLPKRPVSRVKGKEEVQFSDKDLAQFRKKLFELRLSIVGKAATLKTNALEQTTDRVGEDEDGSDSFIRLQNLGQVGEQNRVLQQIDEALHRIEDGTYGICTECGKLIRKQRLQHLPFALACMECQVARESSGALPQ